MRLRYLRRLRIKMSGLALTALMMLVVPSRGADDTVFFVVRHAEKLTGTGDVGLSDAGKNRAELLAQVLIPFNVSMAYHTDTQRAKQTAKPLATKLAMTPRVYGDADQTWVDGVVSTQQGKRVLIVGHSNTIHEIAGQLSGQAVPAIGDDFDNMFIIVISGNKKSMVQLKYGDAN